MLGENTGSGRKGGKLRDIICNVRFFHREDNYIYPDYHGEADKAGSGAKETQNVSGFAHLHG